MQAQRAIGERERPCTAVNTACIDLPAPALGGPAGRTCTCTSGFQGDGVTSCTDIDACLPPSNACHPDAICTDLPAPAPGDASGRRCACKPGFAGDGVTACAAPCGCPAVFTAPLQWPQTLCSQSASQACPFGPGTITRACSSGGQFQTPNASLCVNRELFELFNETTQVNESNVDGVARSLANLTKYGGTLGKDDMPRIVALFEGIINTTNYTNDTMQVG